jgi:hypothetical protein
MGSIFCSYSQVEFISPLPNSKYHPRESNIIIRYGDSLDLASLSGNPVKITGYFDVEYEYSIRLASDHKTIIIDPVNIFNAGEVITIEVSSQIRNIDGTQKDSLNFSFKISENDLFASKQSIDYLDAIHTEKSILNDTTPATFPKLNVITNTVSDSGYIYFQNTSGMASANDRYMAIIDLSGKPVFLYPG